MIATRLVKLDDTRSANVRELTVAQVRQWLVGMEGQAAENTEVDVVGALLFEDTTLSDLARMSDLTVEDMNKIAPSVLDRVRTAAKELNPHFFAMRGRLLQPVQVQTVPALRSATGSTP